MKLFSAIVIFLFPALLWAQTPGRDWSVNPISIIEIVSEKYTQDGSVDEDQSSQSLVIDFGRNFGKFEIGPDLRYAHYKSDSFESTSSYIGGFFRFNFVENAPGTMLIPFARISVLFGESKSENFGFGESKTRGTLLSLRGGVTYFPVNDYVGLEGYVGLFENRYSPTNRDYRYNGFSLNGRFIVYF